MTHFLPCDRVIVDRLHHWNTLPTTTMMMMMMICYISLVRLYNVRRFGIEFTQNMEVRRSKNIFDMSFKMITHTYTRTHTHSLSLSLSLSLSHARTHARTLIIRTDLVRIYPPPR